MMISSVDTGTGGDTHGVVPTFAPLPSKILSFHQLTSKINAILESKKNNTLDEAITQTIQYYSKNGRRTDLFYFLSRNIQFDDFIILIGMKLLVEDLQPTDSDYGKIFDYICNISAQVVSQEAKLTWIQIALYFTKFNNLQAMRIRLVKASNIFIEKELESSTVHLYLDLLYAMVTDRNQIEIGTMSQKNEVLFLHLCRIYHQYHHVNDIASKVGQVAKQHLEGAIGIINFCGIIQTQTDMDIVQGAIRLVTDVFRDYFGDNSLNYFLSALLAGVNSFNRSPALADTMRYSIGQLLSFGGMLLQHSGDLFTWRTLTDLIEYILEVVADSEQLNCVIDSAISLFQSSKSNCIYPLSQLINASRQLLTYGIRKRSYQIELDYLCKNNETEDTLHNVLKSYLALEARSKVSSDALYTQITSTLKVLHCIPDAFLTMSIDYIDQTGADESLGAYVKRVNTLLSLISLVKAPESEIERVYNILNRNITNGIIAATDFDSDQNYSIHLKKYIIQFVENEDGCHLTKCLETTVICLNAIYSLNFTDRQLWKCFELDRSELLSLIFSFRSCNNQLICCHGSERITCPIAVMSINMRELYQTAINGLKVEMRFLMDPALFEFASTPLLLNVIGGNGVEENDNLSSALENHALMATLGAEMIMDIIEIFDKLSVTEHSSGLAGIKDPFEAYKKAFFGDENNPNQPNDLKLEDISQAAISTFSTLFSYFPLIEDYSSKHIVTTHPYSIFIHRLAVSCRPMLVSNPSSNEQRSQVTLNSIALSALTIAIVDLPSKVLKVRWATKTGAMGHVDGWLMDGIINYFHFNIARNWPFENIPWFLEFLSSLIRRPDLATILNDEKYYFQIFTILANFTNGDSWCKLKHYDDESRYDHHYCISLAHLNILKLFLRIAPEKRQHYLVRLIGSGKNGLLYVQGISDIEDKIKEKRHRLRRNSFGAKNPQKRDEKRIEDEKNLRLEIMDLEKKLKIHQDLLTTTRDIFKHNLHFQVPVYVPPREDLIPYFTDSDSKSWVRGYNIHTITTRKKGVNDDLDEFNPYLPDFEEIIRKPSGMVRNYGIIHNIRHNISNYNISVNPSTLQPDNHLTPDKIYLYKYDTSDPCGRSISDSLLITADGIQDTLNHLDRLLPYYRPQIAVVYVNHGQSDWLDIFENSSGSARFHQFVTSLGDQISLKKSTHDLEHNILISGLECEKHGLYTIIKDDDAMKIQYQIAPFMPSNTANAKAAPIGNREVMIVWDDSNGHYIPGQQFSDFPFIEIVITPCDNGLCKVQTLVTSQFIVRQRGEMKLPNKLKSFQKLKSGTHQTRQLKPYELGGPIYITDKNVPHFILTQVIHHSLTLKFCDSKRRNPSSDPFLETVTACDRMNQIKRIHDEALRDLRESGPMEDSDFNLDFVFESSFTRSSDRKN